MRSDFKQRVADDIKRYGWHCINVPDFELGSLSYTIGLQETFDHPELAIFGLDVHLQHELLHLTVEQIRNGKRFDVDGEVHEVLAGGAVLLASIVHHECVNEVFAQAVMYARSRRKVSGLQLFWPDRNGLYSWESGALPSRQPRLYRPIQ